jgi:hypothetical protein
MKNLNAILKNLNTVLIVFLFICCVFIYAQDPKTHLSPQSPDYINPEQDRAQELQNLLTLWYEQARNYKTIIQNSTEKADVTTTIEYKSKLKELDDRINQLLPIMQKYD